MQSFAGCDAKSNSLRVRAFWLAIVAIVDLNPIFEIFPQFLFNANPAFMTFLLPSLMHPLFFGCHREVMILPAGTTDFRVLAPITAALWL